MNAKNPFDVSAIWNPDNDILKTANKAACQFWDSPTNLLDSMQTFAEGWFDPRHQGTKAAFNTVQKACAVQNQVDAFTCYQEWIAGVTSRLLEDEIAYQKLLAAAISSANPAQLLPDQAKAQMQEFLSRAAA